MPQKKHSNQERTVKCPVEGCDYEGLARSLHLHVRQSSNEGHGPHGDIPDHIDLQSAETVGTQKVEMDYPESRDVETVARQCPFCGMVFNGKHGVMIHIGQTTGKKNHPEDATEQVETEDLPVVELDDDENIVNVVEGDAKMPSTKRRQQKESEESRVKKYIKRLREEDKDEEADIAEQELLG
jgi:uncharacterized C2H2 Zn-finger protein